MLQKTGLVLAGQSPTLAPADRLLYALRDATATVESIPLIASSILSKKIAEGTDALVMDVKVGRGAFLTERRAARALAHTLVRLGKRAGLEVVALLTAMDQPIGAAIGNACELAEAIDVLRGAGPADTCALTRRLGAEMLLLGGRAADRADGDARIARAMADGSGLEILRACVRAQGGDVAVIDAPERLPRAPRVVDIRARRSGVLVGIDAGRIGRGATLLGAGRMRQEDRIDPGVGLVLDHKVGARVKVGDRLATVRFRERHRWDGARELLEGAFDVTSEGAPPRPRRMVLETIG